MELLQNNVGVIDALWSITERYGSIAGLLRDIVDALHSITDTTERYGAIREALRSAAKHYKALGTLCNVTKCY